MSLLPFYNSHYGETGLIVCNGPSLKDVSLKFLKKYTTFGFNNIFLKDGFVPSYYVAVDPLAVIGCKEKISNISTVKFLIPPLELVDEGFDFGFYHKLQGIGRG